MKRLLMVDRTDEHGDVDAEPVLVSVTDGELRLELDDATGLTFDVGELLDVIDTTLEDEEASAA